MRKLITILLIAFIACVEVETIAKKEESEVSDFNELLDLLDLDANSVELGWLSDIFKKVGNFFKGIWNGIKGTVKWLKDKGIWDKLVSLAKTGARIAVTSLCSTYLSPAVCTPVVNAVFSLV